MKEKMKNLELKIYKLLGVKKFRNAIIQIIYITSIPIDIILKIPKEESKKLLLSTSGNYFMKKGNGLQDLKDFKKWICFNTIDHIIMLILTATILYVNPIFNTIFAILNLYCIMLQRYNYIRINNVIKKHEKYEANKINKLKLELKEQGSLLKEHTYSLKQIGKKEETKTLDELLENASLEKLKNIKKLLEDISYKEEMYEKYPNLIHSSTVFKEKNKSYYLTISRSK